MLLLLGVSCVFAQEQDSLSKSDSLWLDAFLELNEMVFSARKEEEQVSNVAGQIKVVDQKEIHFSEQANTADVLMSTGQVNVQKSQVGGGSPVLRGFEANRVLIMVDGVRMNNAIYRSGHLQDVMTLDPDILDRAEVLFGPASLMYGSDALGGVMHFYTKNPIFSQKEKDTFSLNSYLRIASANFEKSAHVDFNLGGKKWASFSSVSFRDFDELRTGGSRRKYEDFGKNYYRVERINGIDSILDNKSDVVPFSDYQQLDLLQKLSFKLTEHQKLHLNVQYSTSSNVNRNDRLSEMNGALPKYASWYYGPQNRFLGALHWEWNKSNALFDGADVRLSYQNLDQSRIRRKYRDNEVKGQWENVAVYALNIDLNKAIKSKHLLNYGLETYYNLVQSNAHVWDVNSGVQGPTDTRYPDGSSVLNGAVYLAHKWFVNEYIIINDGARLTYNQLDANFTDNGIFTFPFENVSQKNTAFNGNLGVVIKPNENLSFNLLGSSGFRAPNIDDVAKIFDSQPGSIMVPNEKLKPEYILNFEAGFGAYVIERKIKLEGGYSYAKLLNALVRAPFQFNGQDSILYDGAMSQVTANQNAASADVQTLWGGAKITLNRNLALKSTLTFTMGDYRMKDSSRLMPLGHIPPLYGMSSVMFNFKHFKGEIFAQYNAAKALRDYGVGGEDNADLATPEGTLAWVTFNFRLAYQISEQFKLSIFAYNILDHHYRVFSSGVSAPGRNIGATLRFTL